MEGTMQDHERATFLRLVKKNPTTVRYHAQSPEGEIAILRAYFRAGGLSLEASIEAIEILRAEAAAVTSTIH
jgi:hypothetical protein